MDRQNLYLYYMLDATGKRPAVRLSALPAGNRAMIRDHEESDFRLTLMEMGCIPGEPVWVEMIAPLGDPMAIRIAGYHLSIRKKDADRIWVELL